MALALCLRWVKLVETNRCCEEGRRFTRFKTSEKRFIFYLVGRGLFTWLGAPEFSLTQDLHKNSARYMHIFLLTTRIHHFSLHPALCPTWPNLTCLISTFWSACLILTQEHDSQVWVCIKFLVVLLRHSSHPNSSLSKHHTDPCAFASSSGTLSSHSSGFLLCLFHQTPIFHLPASANNCQPTPLHC